MSVSKLKQQYSMELSLHLSFLLDLSGCLVISVDSSMGCCK
jgi:hypothetical protein